jgi:hypothetical protein
VLLLATLQSSVPVAVQTFQKGDAVLLAEGPYKGTIGTFLNLTDDDPKWADILEQNSGIRSHPVEWLQHSPDTGGALCTRHHSRQHDREN